MNQRGTPLLETEHRTHTSVQTSEKTPCLSMKRLVSFIHLSWRKKKAKKKKLVKITFILTNCFLFFPVLGKEPRASLIDTRQSHSQQYPHLTNCSTINWGEASRLLWTHSSRLPTTLSVMSESKAVSEGKSLTLAALWGSGCYTKHIHSQNQYSSLSPPSLWWREAKSK